MAVNWTKADEISDRIVDIVNERLKQGVDPISIYVGQLLGLVSFIRTSPRQSRPEAMTAVLEASMDALIDLEEIARHMPAVRAIIEKRVALPPEFIAQREKDIAALVAERSARQALTEEDDAWQPKP